MADTIDQLLPDLAKCFDTEEHDCEYFCLRIWPEDMAEPEDFSSPTDCAQRGDYQHHAFLPALEKAVHMLPALLRLATVVAERQGTSAERQAYARKVLEEIDVAQLSAGADW